MEISHTNTIISCYSPTNSSDQDVIDNFYQSLSSVTRQVPKHNFLIIGGDLNAQIGHSSTHKFSYHKSSNRNGLLLEEFIEEHELLCLNKKFQKHCLNSGQSHMLTGQKHNWTISS